MRAGIFDIREDVYHADKIGNVPTLSSSIARLLIERSPRHAWTAHPRLNPAYEAGDIKATDLGSVVHTILLGKGAGIKIVDADDWRTKAAKEARDEAVAMKFQPILRKHAEQAQHIVAAARAQIEAHEELANIFANMRAEATLVWQDGDAWCRSRPDVLPHAGNILADLKTTTTSAHPDAVQRRLFDTGADVQAAFYLRGARAVLGRGDEWHFRFVVVETEPPYALSVIALSPYAMAQAETKVNHAIRWWQRCTASDWWPGYPRRTCYVDPPVWTDKKWAAQAEREATAKDSGENYEQSLAVWGQLPSKEQGARSQ